MTKLLANLAIVLGTVVAGFALIAILGLLPVDLMLLADTHTKSNYWRATPTASQNFANLQYALLLGGFMLFIAGVVLRQRPPGNAA